MTEQEVANPAGISLWLLQSLEKSDQKCELEVTIEVTTIIGFKHL